MNDLIAFIEARLAEDEATARQATPGPWTTNGTSVWREPSDTWDFRAHMISDRMPFVVLDGREVPERGNPRHIARHDPARVLREVEAGRQMIELYRYAEAAWFLDRDKPDPPTVHLGEWTIAKAVLRQLATTWSDHPGYRAEWQPSLD